LEKAVVKMTAFSHDHTVSEPSTDNGLQAAVHQVAVALQRDLPRIAAEGAQYFGERIPEIARSGVEDLVLECCRANSTLLLDYLARGVSLESVTPSTEVLQLTRALVQRGLSLSAVVRGYRISTQYILEIWADAVGTYGRDDQPALDVVKAGMSYLMAWIDLITEQLSDEYSTELKRLAGQRAFARAEEVRSVLIDSAMDVDTASTRLGYRLNGRHVALVLRDRSAAPSAGSALDSALREIASWVGTGHGLVVRVDTRTAWCWLPAPHKDYLQIPSPTVPVLVAIGRPATSLEGFRRSHREALAALGVGEMAQGPPGTVTFYENVNIAAMCAADLGGCREFVRTELGALSTNDRSARRHRETLRAFYAANSNYRATAAALGIHHNTVRYRLEQAERALGHKSDTRRLAVELALHLTDVLNGPSEE
jgi:hypothetical protein